MKREDAGTCGVTVAKVMTISLLLAIRQKPITLLCTGTLVCVISEYDRVP